MKYFYMDKKIVKDNSPRRTFGDENKSENINLRLIKKSNVFFEIENL